MPDFPALVPTDIKLLQKSRVVEITFDNATRYVLPCEYLRVYSPSAEVRGHGGQGGKLVTDKQDVNIVNIELVGNYALKFIFDDGHSTGLYSWSYLYELAVNHQENWQRYLKRLAELKQSR